MGARKITKLFIMPFVMLVSGSVYAQESFTSDAFIGLEGSFVKLQGDIGGLFAQEAAQSDGFGYGVRAGAQNEKWRTTFAFDKFDSDEQSLESATLLVDYRLYGGSNRIKVASFDPYIGMHVGYANYESVAIDENGAIYGAQAGLTLMLTDDVQADLTFRYTTSGINEFDSRSSFSIGLNYFY